MSETSVLGVWRGLRPFVPRFQRRRMSMLAVASVLSGAAEGAILILIVTLAVTLADGAGLEAVQLPVVGGISSGGLVIGAGALGVTLVALNVLVASMSASLSASVMTTTRRRLVTAFAGAAWDRQAKEREGSLQQTSVALAIQSADLGLALATLLGASLALTVLLVTAFVVDPIITLVVLAAGALLLALLRPMRAATRTRSTTFVRMNVNFAERLSEWVRLALESRTFGVAEHQVELLGEDIEEVSSAFRRSRLATRLGASLFRDLAVLFLLGAIILLSLTDEVDLAIVGSVLLLIVRSLAYAHAAQTAAQAVLERAPSFEQLVEHLGALEAEKAKFGDASLDTIRQVELRGVGYEYEPGVSILNEVSTSFRQGEMIGVVGPSGGGKSTLAQILLRLRLPTSGSVLVNGVDHTSISPEIWSRLVAFVPQEPNLFRGSINDNIAFGRDWIDHTTVRAAATDARLLDEIEGMPRGFDTELGPRGSGLSGGQRQRLVIARALAGDPQLLVLDEPTSALDERSEHLVQQTLAALHGRTTMVIVAHRVSTLERCDRVAALAGGQLLVVGSLQDALRALRADGHGAELDSAPRSP